MSSLQKNHFQLLGLPTDFYIDEAQLKKNYLSLQKQFHPDRYALATNQEKRLAVQLIAQLNQARACLLDEVQRAKYLLFLQGLDVPSEQTINDPEFLMQQLQWRESVGAMKKQRQQTPADNHNQQALNATLLTIKQQQAQFSQDFADAFAQQSWDAAKVVLAKMQFTQKLIQEFR